LDGKLMRRAALVVVALLTGFGAMSAQAMLQLIVNFQGTTPQIGNIAIDPTNATVNIGCTGTITSCQTSSAFVAATSNELLIFFAACQLTTSSVTSVTDNGPGLTWTKRSSKVGGGVNAGYASVWWAKAVGSFNAKVTANYSGCGTANAIVAVFGIENAAATPWDANVALPATSSGASSNPSTGPISTTLPDVLMISVLHGNANIAAPTGWTHVPGAGNLANFGGCCTDIGQIDYKIVSTIQTSLTVNYGTSTSQWTTIGDAVDSL
jgi:hypothetical protein